MNGGVLDPHRARVLTGLRRILAVLCCQAVSMCALADPASGQVAAVLISHRYEPVVGCSVVVDHRTRLMWQRCSLGQVWDGRGCIGRPARLEWNAAAGFRDAQCGFNDWHLPEVIELEGLVAEGAIPAIDDTVFPNTPAASYWTASESEGSAQKAWFVSFGRGVAQNMFKDARFHVRLVRTVR
jgi:hypothetical protein